jgi:hypothetical protein
MSQFKINKKRLFKAIDRFLIGKVLSGKLSQEEEKSIREFLRHKGYKI